MYILKLNTDFLKNRVILHRSYNICILLQEICLSVCLDHRTLKSEKKNINCSLKFVIGDLYNLKLCVFMGASLHVFLDQNEI